MSHHRSPSSSSSNGEPTQTHHHSLLPTAVPTAALVESVAGGAHYSGAAQLSPPARRHSSHDASSQSHTAVKGDHARVLEDLRALYECRPTPEIFERSWHPDAVFEDPLAKAKGFREYAAQAPDADSRRSQWYAMPKLFSKSETLSSRVMSSTRVPNRLVFTQKQRYKNRFLDKVRCLTDTTMTIESVVTVDLDESDRIIRLVEQWDGKPLGGAWFRRLNAMIVPLVVSVPRRRAL
ncbi:hypothetical protein B0H11DRAFT_1719766 [Mycena galericulata]|nr:hypothetical protein B0H11DRAFT_1719766 [Mycena galericulata]